MDANDKLIEAVLNGNVDEVESCVAHGGKLNCTRNGMNLLHLAARQGHVAVVRYLLSKGMDVNSTDSFRCSGLMNAAATGQVQVARFLIAEGAMLELRSIWGSTALHMAALASKVEVLKLLLEFGAEVNPRDRDHWTPLRSATDPNVISILKTYGGVVK